MKKSISRQLASAFTAGIALLSVPTVHAAAPVETLWFADSHITAFYAIDEPDHRLILITEPGPEAHEGSSRTERRLAEGERVAISLKGHDLGGVTATLEATRIGKTIDVSIVTASHRETLARQD